MVGIAGVIGETENVGPLFDSLAWRDDEETSTYTNDALTVAVTRHPPFTSDQPVVTNSGAKIWLFGHTYGYENESVYTSKHESHSDATDAEYCAKLYDRHGPKFVSSLNGEFVGVIYEPAEGRMSLFTDRLSSRGLFYTRAEGGELVFTTKIQSLTAYPGVRTSFDLESLYEWFATDRALGTETPLTDVKQVPPASIARVNTDSQALETKTYWKPRYHPIDRPFSVVVEEFTDLLTEVLAERTADDVDYGLLLSGGSDSRAILAGADVPLHCFTMSGWVNNETSLARKCAVETDNEWTFLQRGEDYQIDALDQNPSLSNFVGRFHHGHATGFADELSEEVDVLLSGQFCDTFFKGHFLPIYDFPVDQISTIDVPMERRIESVDAYIDDLVSEATLPEYLLEPPTLREAFESRIERGSDGIVSHGVSYPSLRELVLSTDYYPLTNQPDSFFHDSLVQMMSYRSPFIDNRLIDFHLSVPVKYYLRRNMVNRAVEQLLPPLADIPHSTTGVPLSYSFPFQYVGQKLSTLKRRFLPVDEPPAPHLRQTSWTDHKTIIRERDFVTDTFKKHAATLEESEFIDIDAVRDVYDAHLDGQQRMPEIYSLLTFLEMPVTQRLLGADDATE